MRDKVNKFIVHLAALFSYFPYFIFIVPLLFHSLSGKNLNASASLTYAERPRMKIM